MNLSFNLKEAEPAEEEKQKEEAKKPSGGILKCRTCGGEHFTAKCPYKDTLGASLAATAAPEEPAAAAESGGKGSYVLPHLRNRKEGDPLPSASRYGERDDSTTLRITQLNEIVDEDMLANELLVNYHPLQRVTLVRNRETGKSKGLAYVAFSSIRDAERALEELDGRGYHSLILHLEWSKPKAKTFN